MRPGILKKCSQMKYINKKEIAAIKYSRKHDNHAIVISIKNLSVFIDRWKSKC